VTHYKAAGGQKRGHGRDQGGVIFDKQDVQGEFFQRGLSGERTDCIAPN
jgi:hypothetical protein